ncbi:hypothetical protein A3A39_01560 [Candidatus Kaiserbacteria bacterium RIFCSPLOWO2_01_FULL_54_13]|uniref:GIY-YIG domain-containing protein n=1 Tax=Candidatus Kaiserbacteria bacterium RIFCSPLOWO2_01_FULL_54_13 TaxID=1798512 RepID=A0A1F6F3W1_9BACT|nr:MAG: hypothetical protein A3A39_01560 [Candidatus Kaiserbacteria bacterium RIFCSPLOWO2_01_FULL_54_13]
MEGFVYILRTNKGTKYIGSTTNLKRRLSEHVAGKVNSTQRKLPIVLIAYRCFTTIKDAALWEKKYKRSHDQLERAIRKGIFVLTPNGELRPNASPAGQSPPPDRVSGRRLGGARP